MEDRLAYTERTDYDANGNAIYTGYARSESDPSTAAPVWAIKKLTWDVNGNCTLVQWANGNNLEEYVWDNRASLTYK